MGVIISAAVIPATLTLLWSGQSWAAATFAPPLGFCCSVSAWLATAQSEFGEVTVASTGSNIPMLAGNVVSLFSPVLFILILTFVPPFKRQNYDWQSMLEIRRGGEPADDRDEAAEQAALLRARKIARVLCVSLTIILLVVWPMPLYGTGYIFSKSVSSITSHFNPTKHPTDSSIIVFYWMGVSWYRLALRVCMHDWFPSSI